jgi:hypothetical protein
MRLNLIKFFSKLIYTISNDYTGDNIYQIFNSNRLFHILIDLLLRHIYNNFLHTQVYLIIRLIIHINSIAVKRSNEIWTRTSLPVQDQLVKSGINSILNDCRSDWELTRDVREQLPLPATGNAIGTTRKKGTGSSHRIAVWSGTTREEVIGTGTTRKELTRIATKKLGRAHL